MSDSPVVRAIVIVLLLFLAAVTAGWAGSAQNPAVGEQLLELFEREVAGQIDGTNPFDMCPKLFLNNLQACILLFLGGASFGTLTLFIMGVNGIVIGAILEMVSREHAPLFVAAAIVPHGIFEIPAFVISGALGVLLARSLIAEWYGGIDAAAAAHAYGRMFIVFVLPLVAVAACVEAFITPVVIHLVA